MGISLALLPAIWLLFLFLCQSTALTPQSIVQTSCRNREDQHLISELQEAQLKIARLESILEESISILNSRSLYLNESEKLIKEMTREVDHLQSVLLSVKDDLARTYVRLDELEEMVRLLWVASRKNNFELHTLESKLQDAEKRLEMATSQVEKAADIVTEQWIQVQQLEQALQIAETSMMKIKRQVSSTRCSFLKFIRSHFGHLENLRGMLERTLSAAKHYHHQLQGFVKHEMEKSKYTAAFTNKEVVFFVASALITFPALSVGMFILSQF